MLKIFHDPSDRRYVTTVPGEIMSIMMPGADVDERYAIVESICEPGTAVPQHVHDGEEIFYIAEGELTFLTDGKLTVAPQYSLVVVPRGTVHAWRNRSQSKVRMLVIFAPGGIDKVLQNFDKMTMAKIEERSAHYGTRVVGPPIAA
jgi:quercetin dioxygenase-like cupin family protein